MSLEAAINTPEESFVNDPITGTVKFPKAQMGGKFFTCLLEDGQFSANLSCDEDIFTANVGKRVTFSKAQNGKGHFIKRKDTYNGKAKISLGKLTLVTPAGQATPAQQHSKETQAYPLPPTRTEGAGQTVTMTAKTGMAADELASAWATVAREAARAFKTHGFTDEAAEAAALKAPEWAALWWFGEKSVRFEPSLDEDVPY